MIVAVARFISVDDPADPRVADYVGLTDAELRRRIERPGGSDGGAGLFVVEGTLAVGRLLASPYEVRSVLVTPSRLAKLEVDLASVEAPVYVAAQPVMNAVAGFNIHRGLLAAAVRRHLPPASDLLRAARCVAVLEGLNDHENMGAVFRNAAALGVDAVLLCPQCCDPLYRRSVRVSVGHVLTVPFTRLQPWPHALAQVREAGFRLLALTPAAGAVPIDQIDVGGGMALLLGAEGPGLSEAALAYADQSVRIPMRPGGDSLNVATAAAIAFHRLAPSTEREE